MIFFLFYVQRERQPPPTPAYVVIAMGTETCPDTERSWPLLFAGTLQLGTARGLNQHFPTEGSGSQNAKGESPAVGVPL